MAKKSRFKQKRRPIRPEATYCRYCKADKTPDYKEYEELAKYLSERAKILGKKRSGICSSHQRKLSVAIKRARYLGLLPFTPHL